MLTAVHRRREPAVAQAGSNRQRQFGTALLGKFEQPGQEWGMRRDIRPVAIALVLAALATSVRAQSSQPVLDLAPGGFSETLLEPGIKGRDVLVDPLRMLVGWHRGSAAGPFRIDQVRALLPLAGTPGDYCVRIASADSRYSALNRYQKTTARAPAMGVEAKSRYASELAQQFSAADVIIRIVSGSTCPGTGDAFIVAAVPPGATDTQKLLAYLNVRGSHAQISLVRADKTLAVGQCERPDKAAILYSDICSVTVSDLNGATPEALRVTYVNNLGRVANTDFRLIWGSK